MSCRNNRWKSQTVPEESRILLVSYTITFLLVNYTNTNYGAVSRQVNTNTNCSFFHLTILVFTHSLTDEGRQCRSLRWCCRAGVSLQPQSVLYYESAIRTCTRSLQGFQMLPDHSRGGGLKMWQGKLKEAHALN